MKCKEGKIKININSCDLKDINFRILLKKICRYFYKYKVNIFTAIFLYIIDAIITVISPKIAGGGITALSSLDANGFPNIDLDYVFKLLSVLLIIYSVSGLCNCLSRYLLSKASVGLVYDIRKDISIKLSKVKLGYIESKSRGDILSCIINDVDVLSTSLISNICNLITSSIVALGTLVMMFTISWEMTLTSIFVVPVVSVVTIFFIKNSQKYFSNYQENLGKINGFIEEMLSGYETIKMFNSEKEVLDNFDFINYNLRDTSYKAQFLSGFISPIMRMISNIMYIVSCVFGGYLAITRSMVVGDIVAFITYSDQFIKPFIEIAGSLSNFQSAFAAGKRIFEFLDASDEYNNNKSIDRDIKNIKNCSIEFKDVSFSYNGSELAIENLSFNIGEGKSVAIVGETGSGKTTVAKLIMRLYDITSGDIFISGRNIKDFNIDYYRSLFGIVTQDSWLFNSTIMENIRYGNTQASDEEVKFIAKKIGLSHFIDSLPLGYDTVLEEGITNISEGQKQLLCIARALISDCKILVLDEATASVDTFTESCLQKSLKKLLQKKTSIIIAHRLSTIKEADLILVLQKGKLVEQGKHNDLLLNQGVYYEMYSKS